MGSRLAIPSQAAPSAEQLSVSTGAPWSGRILTALAAGVRLGLFENLAVAIGITLLACTVLHVIPRTSTLGAALLTGYLGGAVSIQRLVGNPLCSQTRLPVYSCGLDCISGEARLRAPVPLRS